MMTFISTSWSELDVCVVCKDFFGFSFLVERVGDYERYCEALKKNESF